MLLPQRLKQLRLENDLTQEGLAKHLPINRGTYAHYELGKRQPDLETLVRIAVFYNVSTDYLLGLTDLPVSAQTLINYCQKLSNEYPASKERGELVADLNKHHPEKPKEN
ncbi:MAG: helix-turn-helix domain-containing protein [Saccharofermentanales bacterium]